MMVSRIVGALSVVLGLALGGCQSAPATTDGSSSAAVETHACPTCKADLTAAAHEQCPECKERPWWTHATKVADAPPSRPMSVRCPKCAGEVPIEVQQAQ